MSILSITQFKYFKIGVFLLLNAPRLIEFSLNIMTRQAQERKNMVLAIIHSLCVQHYRQMKQPVYCMFDYAVTSSLLIEVIQTIESMRFKIRGFLSDKVLRIKRNYIGNLQVHRSYTFINNLSSLSIKYS